MIQSISIRRHFYYSKGFFKRGIHTSRLANGINVTTTTTATTTASSMQAIGVLLGRNYLGEVPNTTAFRPSAYLFEKLAFKSTNFTLSEARMQERLDRIVGSLHARSNRDSILLAGVMEGGRAAAGQILDVFSQILQDSRRVTPAEMEEMHEAATYEVSEMTGKPEELIPELVQSTALQGSGGQSQGSFIRDADSILAVPQGLLELRESAGSGGGAIQDLIASMLSSPAQNIHLVGTGIPHESLVELAQEFGFDRLGGGGGGGDDQGTAISPTPTTPLLYRGGQGYFEGIFEGLGSQGLRDQPDLAHLAIAFKAPAATEPDAYPAAVLQMLLGGGGSFSAGGPGKGMYSRLYTQLLNRHHWLESARAFTTLTVPPHGEVDPSHHHISIQQQINMKHTSNGQQDGSSHTPGFTLFGIHGSASPLRARELTGCLIDQLRRMHTSLTDAEVSRAKRQVQSAVLMGVESRMVELEDLADQLLQARSTWARPGGGPSQAYVSPREIFERIEAVGVEDLVRVAHRILSEQDAPTVVAFGSSLQRMPSYGQICAMLHQRK